MAENASQVLSQLKSQKGLEPTMTWLMEFLATQRGSTPMAALVQAAEFRLLISDVANSILHNQGFPSTITDSSIREQRLQGRILVQILDVENISLSSWSQIQAIEARERGETTRGREIIQVTSPPTVSDAEALDQDSTNSNVTHKVLMQDCHKTLAFGLELQPIEKIHVGMKIGSKFLLQDAVCTRGMVLLEPSTTKHLGGKLDDFHETWIRGRKARLQQRLDEANS